MIYSTGFYRNKAKSIQGAARRVVEAYNGEVPADINELLTLPGVARKTANVVLAMSFASPKASSSIPMSSVFPRDWRLSQESTPEKIERDLMALAPREEWIDLSHLLIFQGRRVCDAKKPNCASLHDQPAMPSSTV